MIYICDTEISANAFSRNSWLTENSGFIRSVIMNSLLNNHYSFTIITLLMSGTAGYTFINIQAFKVNNWFIKVTFTRNPHLIPPWHCYMGIKCGLRVNDLYKPIIHFKCLLGVYLFMNKHLSNLNPQSQTWILPYGCLFM